MNEKTPLLERYAAQIHYFFLFLIFRIAPLLLVVGAIGGLLFLGSKIGG